MKDDLEKWLISFLKHDIRALCLAIDHNDVHHFVDSVIQGMEVPTEVDEESIDDVISGKEVLAVGFRLPAKSELEKLSASEVKILRHRVRDSIIDEMDAYGLVRLIVACEYLASMTDASSEAFSHIVKSEMNSSIKRKYERLRETVDVISLQKLVPRAIKVLSEVDREGVIRFAIETPVIKEANAFRAVLKDLRERLEGIAT